ncbi:MAG: exonuclease domain-containing protein [Clostridia bacterium]|nr:exonuclease domain-containing protein [Clostridia bacterium]
MNYVILDLEWNQPVSHQESTYRRVGDRLIFEMIQIGAVKLNADREIVDSLSVPIQPTWYTRIHPRIRRMTGLTPEILDEAPRFEEAIERFVDWCGEDYCLLTWGCDDVSVLQQNMDFFDVHPDLPPLCDIQHFFSDVYELKNRMGLKPAMDMLHIDPDEEKSFHNAVNDAYYTALVFQTLKEPERVLNYPNQPKQLIHPQEEPDRNYKGDEFASIREALEGELAQNPRCAVCGKPCAVEEAGYVPQTADQYVGLAKCSRHGVMLVRLRFRPRAQRQRWMGVSVAKATQPNIAYVHTKQFQYNQKKAAGRVPDPELALEKADWANVPFE